MELVELLLYTTRSRADLASFVRATPSSRWPPPTAGHRAPPRVCYQGADGVLYVGFGRWQHGGLLHNGMAPAVAALDPATGAVLWTKLLGEGQSGHGGVRSCIMDGETVDCPLFRHSG